MREFVRVQPSQNYDQRIISQLQDNIGVVTYEFTSRPENDSVIVSDISMTASTDKLIEHGLGRAFRGWWIVDKNADCRIWKSGTSDTDKFLTLQSSANVTISVLVF